ncbi:MAG: hypothetical protein NTW32_07490, partial [Chloroflexi bacterium]|nr:hypothetical protein [Chloroflexota bacterium]
GVLFILPQKQTGTWSASLFVRQFDRFSSIPSFHELLFSILQKPCHRQLCGRVPKTQGVYFGVIHTSLQAGDRQVR